MAAEKHVLVLGSGYVALPAIEYILRRPENHVTVGCRTLKTAQDLVKGLQRTTPVAIDVNDEAALDALVAKHDLTVSLIPWTHHVLVLKSAIRNKKNVVTTSYVNPKMLELEKEVEEAGITMLNEIGLDPGIDHFYALKMIDSVHEQGGKILSFLSYCGGLPAPENSNNPLGYKFSWSPRGVFLAVRSQASYIGDGKKVVVPPQDLLKTAKPIYVYPAFALEGYPNRDSTPYDKRYNIPEAHTILRGTLRYQGNPQFVQALIDIGIVDETPQPHLAAGSQQITWAQALAKLFGTSDDVKVLREEVVKRAHLSGESQTRILNGMRWIGLFSTEPAPLKGTYLDALAATLEAKMSYQPHERDMILLQHKFEIEFPDGAKETRTSTLLEFGQPGGVTAMAKTVGIPCGIGVQLILDGKITRKGILAPMSKDIYVPMLELLEKEGIKCEEEIVDRIEP